jgi:hypothetical protein
MVLGWFIFTRFRGLGSARQVLLSLTVVDIAAPMLRTRSAANYSERGENRDPGRRQKNY